MFARDAAAFIERTGKPLVVAAPQESVAAIFRAAGVPAFANQTEAMAALAQLAGHAALMRRPVATASRVASVSVPDGDSRFVDEASSLGFLQGHGLPTVAYRLCRTALEAEEAMRHFASPVAVKGCSSAVPHKSEHGLVALNVTEPAAAAAAFERLMATLAALNAPDRQVIVAPMVRGWRELMLGVRIDPQFGPVVLVGDGGKHVEVLQDIQLLIPPLSLEDARQAVGRLRIAPLFAGVRGEPALDAEALGRAMVRLGDVALACADEIASIDLNPVLIGSVGEGIVIVDAVVERNVRAAVTG
jgi:acyl-CoA synthetase (NDP forming)